MDMNNEKQPCNGCGQWLEKDAYYTSKWGCKQEYSLCKECMKKRQQEDRRANPVKALFRNARKIALKRGLKFNLQQGHLHMPETCPILGIPLIVSTGNKSKNSPTLYRLNPKQGYTEDNVLIISVRASKLLDLYFKPKSKQLFIDMMKIQAFIEQWNKKKQ